VVDHGEDDIGGTKQYVLWVRVSLVEQEYACTLRMLCGRGS
jgi:hypothetical protein